MKGGGGGGEGVLPFIRYIAMCYVVWFSGS